MITEETYALKNSPSLSERLSDYVQFIKLRLAVLVVFSAVIGYLIGSPYDTNWFGMLMLIIGGLLVTGSSNGFNQIIERDVDKLMTRTANRPLPSGRMSVTEATILASIMGLAGIFILTYYMNVLSGILGALALLLYTCVYTPLKKVTPLAVFVGAFPGAIPPMLGWIASPQSGGELGLYGWILFTVQFMWQFPHFWAIAWVLEEDYKRAGFRMLPSLGGRDKSSAFQILVYTLFLIPISLVPVMFGMSHSVSAVIILISSLLFAWQAYKLYKKQTVKAAQQLMFGSFIYLPVVQLAVLIG